MKRSRVKELLGRFQSLRIGVLGDYFLDQYFEVDPTLAEPSVETGKTAHQVTRCQTSAGAAGTIVNNLSALGVGRIYALGLIGQDGAGYELRKSLKRVGCKTEGLIDVDEMMTPVYLKPFDRGVEGLAAEHSRYDVRNRRATPVSATKELIQNVERQMEAFDALILLDQVESETCETVTPMLREWFITQARSKRRMVSWVDSRFHVDKYDHVWIKPNQFEAIGQPRGGPDDEVEAELVIEALQRLRSSNQAPVTITLGDQGLWVSDPEPTLLPAFPTSGPTDTTGAGDSLTAAMVAALCSGATHVEAGWLGSLVASLTVQQLGTTGTARPSQVLDRFDEWSQTHEALENDES